MVTLCAAAFPVTTRGHAIRPVLVVTLGAAALP
jgi:hypothetical protein